MSTPFHPVPSFLKPTVVLFILVVAKFLECVHPQMAHQWGILALTGYVAHWLATVAVERPLIVRDYLLCTVILLSASLYHL